MEMKTTFVSTKNKGSDFDNECKAVSLCDPCMRNTSSNAATVFCKDCNELFCDQCSHLHTIFKPGKHDIISIADMDSVRAVVDMKGTDICLEHDEKIKFFCRDHSKLCCCSCAFIHRKCEHVDDISTLIEQTRSEIDALKQSLQQIDSDAENGISYCKKSEKNLTDCVKNISEEVDEMKTRFIKLFDEAKKKMLTEANTFTCEEAKRLGNMSAEYEKIKEEITQLVPTCSTLLKHGTPQQMFIMSKLIDEKHQRMKASIGTQQSVQLTPKLSMSFPREISVLLELGDKVVTLNCERSKSEKASSDSPTSLPGPVTFELLVSVDLPKTRDDKKEPFLTGLDFLSDGRLVAVDNSNDKCIILNELLQMQGSPYTFKMHPHGVCVYQNGLVVTAGNRTLHLLSVSSDNVISLTREFSTSSSFDSICHMTPSVMVVGTFNDPRPTRMLTLDGVESDFDRVEFPMNTYTVGASKCTYVQSKNTLVLSDRDSHTVYLYDIVKGTSRAVTDGNIQNPCGASVGPGDTVLVCSRGKNAIVHLSIDGGVLGTYPVDMVYPYSLSMSKDGTKLAVSNIGVDTHKLQLYQISRT